VVGICAFYYKYFSLVKRILDENSSMQSHSGIPSFSIPPSPSNIKGHLSWKIESHDIGAQVFRHGLKRMGEAAKIKRPSRSCWAFL
jgi:hypothetical protein